MGAKENGAAAQQRQAIQIIAIGLIGGVVMLGIVVAIACNWAKLNFNFTPLAGIAGSLLVATCGASLVVPNQLLRAAGRQFRAKNPAASDSALITAGTSAVQIKTIIRAALNEASVLFGLIIFYLESNGIGLIAAIVSALVLIAGFPFDFRIDADLDTFREEYRQAK